MRRVGRVDVTETESVGAAEARDAASSSLEKEIDEAIAIHIAGRQAGMAGLPNWHILKRSINALGRQSCLLWGEAEITRAPFGWHRQGFLLHLRGDEGRV